MERTLVVIKPDGVQRNLIGEIISRFEKVGLRIVAMKMVKVNRKFAEKQYPDTDKQIIGMGNKTLQATREETGSIEEVKRIFGTEDPREIGKTLRNWMVEYLISGPVVAMILEGEDAIKKAREIGGFTDPSKAKKGTIRGDLGEDSIYKANKEKRATKNLVHLAGDKEEVKREIELWFKKDEIYSD